jgi:hypothetical protein
MWWEDDHFLRLTFVVQVADEVQRELLDPLRSLGIPADIPAQGGAIPLEQIGAYIQLISASLGRVASALVVADRINAWRHNRREQQQSDPPRPTTAVFIIRPGREPLDIANSTDDEVTKYIIEGREPEQ